MPIPYWNYNSLSFPRNCYFKVGDIYKFTASKFQVTVTKNKQRYNLISEGFPELA